MTAPLATPFSPATDGLTVGRGALRQLHASLLRDAADHAIAILQEAGFAAGQGVFQAFCAWLPGQLGVARPDRSEERRVGKEWRRRWSQEYCKEHEDRRV